MRRFLALPVLLLLCTAANAQNFYVSTTGSDSNSGTSVLAAWRTIQHAMNSATAGSTVNIIAGTYHERLAMGVSGTTGNVITFQPNNFSIPAGGCGGYTGVTCGGDSVILDYASFGTITDGVPLIDINGKSFVTIQGITLQNFTSQETSFVVNYAVRVHGSASNVTLQYLKLFNFTELGALGSAFQHGVWCDSPATMAFQNSELGNILNHDSATQWSCANVTITGNWFHDVDQIGIDAWNNSTNYTVSHNKLEYISIQRNGTPYYNNPSIGLYNDGGNHGLWDSNSCNHCGLGIVQLAEPGNSFAHDIIVRNNIIENSNQTGLTIGTFYSSQGAASVFNMNFWNNTFYNNNPNVAIPNPGVQPFTAASVTWENNIFFGSSNYVNPGSWATGTTQYNAYAGGGNTGPGSNLVTSDPLFTNPGAGVFTVKAGSPVIAAGDPASSSAIVGTLDFAGNPRFVGGKIDMGAFEASATPPTSYVDFSSGSDLFDGTAKTHTSGTVGPWKSSPYMQGNAGCSDNSGTHFGYTHTAGQLIILKGGVTWPVACFGMLLGAGGTSSAQDYYGVDLTWFTGGSFTKPKFDMGQVVPSATGGPGGSGHHTVIQAQSVNFWTIDNIEIANQALNQGDLFGNGEAIQAFGTTGVIVKNMFIHDWMTNGTISSSWVPDYSFGGILGPVTLLNSTIDDTNGFGFNSSAVKITGGMLGGGCQNCAEVSGSKFVNTMAACFEVTPCHDSEFTGQAQGIFDNSSPSGYAPLGSNRPHTQIIETENSTDAGHFNVYNNKIHDSSAGVTIYVGYNSNVYNNVLWNNANTSIKLNTVGGDSSSQVGNIYNNTSDCSNGNSCWAIQRSDGSTAAMLGTLNVKNNHWITNGSVTCVIGSGNCEGAAQINQSNNLLMTTTQATTQGYTTGTNYKVFPGSAPTTVAFATNLTAQATGNLAALAKDAEGAPWNGASYVARPTGATAWDAGWAQSPGSGGGTPPTVTVTQPAAGIVSGTVTITVTASGGTIASIQPLVDGNTFGNHCTASPCSVSWDTTKVGNGTHTVGGTATNATGQGTATPVSVTVNNAVPGCTTSAATWTNTALNAAQTSSFTATLNVTPNGVPPTGSGGPIVGLSQTAASSYAGNSTLIRQSDNGFWEVFNGATGLYAHAASVSWIVGTAASFTWSVNVTGQTASVQITQNGVSSTLATNLAFRTAATSIGFWNLDPTSAPVTLQVCNFTIGANGVFSPVSFNFGTVNVGAPAVSQGFTLMNNGGSSLAWTAFNISPSVFTIPSNSCASPLATGASCSLTVQFAPTSPTTYSGTLSMTTTATSNTSTLTGAGSSVSIPSVPTGLAATASGTTVALAWSASTGTAPITYNVNRGTVSGGPYSSIATGLSGTTYSDSNLAPATYYYVVTATNSAGTSANSNQASATITPALPQVNLTPANLAFGNVLTSGSLLETVSNTGTANLIIGTPTVGGPNQLDFSFGAGCTGVTVTPNSSCPILVTFTPSTTTTQEQATLCVPSNAASSGSDCVTMTGQGVLPVIVSPTALNFGNIHTGLTSASQTATFTNQTGATVTFSSIVVTGGDSTQFVKGTDLCGASVPNNSSCTVNVTFQPTAPGSKASALVFTDSATGSPHSVAITGNAVSHKIAKTL